MGNFVAEEHQKSVVGMSSQQPNGLDVLGQLVARGFYGEFYGSLDVVVLLFVGFYGGMFSQGFCG